MDLFVLPSRSEGLPMGLLEAMAAGVPVAATDVGANREVIDDGACGLLLPDDEALWPAVLEAALADRVGLTARAERARERVATRYSMKSTLDEYERIYRRLTSGGRGGCGDDCACGKG
jgi:glycosyltransferase involved in cell wall biosynthesis